MPRKARQRNTHVGNFFSESYSGDYVQRSKFESPAYGTTHMFSLKNSSSDVSFPTMQGPSLGVPVVRIVLYQVCKKGALFLEIPACNADILGRI